MQIIHGENETKHTSDEIAGWNTFTSFFLKPFLSAYYINLEDMSCKVFKRNERVQERFPDISNYLKSISEHIDADVHQDDKEMLRQALRPENIRKRLAGQEQYSLVFRDISEGAEKIFRCQIIRGEDEQHAALGFKDITQEVQEQQQALMKTAESQHLVENFIGSYDSVYVINLPDGTLERCIMSPSVMKKVGDVHNFSEVRETFLTKICHPIDVNFMATELDYKTIRAKLAVEPSYTVEFCTIDNGATMWKKMRVTSLSENKIILGIIEDDLEIAKHCLEEKRYEEYFSIFAVDLDTEMLRIVKNEGNFNVFALGRAFPYATVMKAFIDFLPSEESRAFFTQISDLDYVRAKLAKEDKYTYAFKSSFSDKSRWIDVTSYVLRRNKDGSPALCTIGFSWIDSLGAERQELNVRLKQQMDTISGLASEYTGLDYLNLDTEEYTPYQIARKIEDIKPYFDRYPKFTDLFRSFVQSDLVHPDDKESLQAFFPSVEAVRRALDGKKRISTFFRRNYEGEYLWTEMDLVKCEGANEEAHNVIVGFAEKDKEIREKQGRDKYCANNSECGMLKSE